MFLFIHFLIIAANQEKKPRKPKQVYQIPFDSEELDGDEETLFGTTTRPLTLSKDVISKMKEQGVPDDIHFSSKQLLQYFIKPMFPVIYYSFVQSIFF